MSADPGAGRGDPGGAPPKRQIFREEALRRRIQAREFGDVLRLPPSWTRLVYPLVVAAALSGALLACVTQVRQYARGPAVVRAQGARFTVVALLPASHLPELLPGMPLRVEIDGRSQASLHLEIEQLERRAVGPAEARRALGAVADAVEVTGTVVVVRASLPGTALRTADGERPFHDGMLAEAETPVRSERLIFALFPGLKAALGG